MEEIYFLISSPNKAFVNSNTLKLERLTINTDWIGSSYFYLYNFQLLMIVMFLQKVMSSLSV